MNLRRVRIELTLLYGVLSAIAILLLATVASHWGTEQLYREAEQDLIATTNEVLVKDFEGQSEHFDNVWFVDYEQQYSEDIGENWVELPLITIAREAWEGDTLQRHTRDGQWLTYAATFQNEANHELAFVAAASLDEVDANATGLRRRIYLMAFGSILLLSGVGWLVAGRSLRPARFMMAQQRNFIADAAHELRTPLAVIQASASHALDRERDAEAYKASLSEVLSATVRASRGVNELLEYARLEAGQASPRLAPLRIDLLIEELAAATRSNDVIVSAEQGEAIVADADYLLLRQALETVVRNATQRAEHVWLSLETQQRFVVLIVADDGPGFSEEVLPHVFDRYRRGDERGSSGLGMAIAHSIVANHGGKAEARNRPEGGAEVRFTIPLSKEI